MASILCPFFTCFIAFLPEQQDVELSNGKRKVDKSNLEDSKSEILNEDGQDGNCCSYIDNVRSFYKAPVTKFITAMVIY